MSFKQENALRPARARQAARAARRIGDLHRAGALYLDQCASAGSLTTSLSRETAMNISSELHKPDSLRERIIRRWRGWRARRADLAALSRCDAAESERIARDTGVDSAGLHDLVARGGDADLLPRRMAALGLDADATARQEAAVMRDMQRLCSLCQSKGRCEHDLDVAARAPHWETYCPNAGVLSDLAAEKRAGDVR
jgi:hypothetical protein